MLYTNDHLVPWSKRFERRTRPVSSVRTVAFPTLREVAEKSFEQGGVEAAEAAIRDFRARRPASANELTLNLYGYELLGSERLDEAIAIFELNSELNPESFNVWDSLAEAHRAAGHRDEAVRFYRKSLELNPNNANATAMLDEMGAD